MRGRVCYLYMLLSLASAVFLGFESLGTRNHIWLSQIWDFPFRRLLRLAGSRWRYCTALCTSLSVSSEVKSKSKLLYDWQFTANQFVLAPGPLRPTTRDCFSNRTLAVIVLISHPLWREGGVVSYEYAWPFVKCIFRTYNMLLKIFPFALHTSPLSVQALQSRSCLSYVSYQSPLSCNKYSFRASARTTL
jgi:hypothetical protein